MLKDLDGDGVIDTQKVILRLKNIHGIAIQGTRMYLTDVTRVYATGTLPPPRALLTTCVSPSSRRERK
jgi:hypothetical protein